VKKSGEPSPIRIFLVDDHPIVRRGFQLLLAMEPGLAVCGEADSAPVALERILALKPDVAIVDLSLKSSSGLELIKQLRNQSATLKILVFSMRAEDFYAERALRAGANGYITKEEGTEKAIEAIRMITQGKPYVSPQLADSMIARMAGKSDKNGAIDLLSDREMEVLELVGKGMGSQEIATSLGISMKTVESHREHIKTKLGLRNASELVRYAFNWMGGR
jgi:DNA-binding NarL/FixJ family response regulator